MTSFSGLNDVIARARVVVQSSWLYRLQSQVFVCEAEMIRLQVSSDNSLVCKYRCFYRNAVGCLPSWSHVKLQLFRP